MWPDFRRILQLIVLKTHSAVLNVPKVADRADKRFLARVRAHVLSKASTIVELFITDTAGMEKRALMLFLA